MKPKHVAIAFLITMAVLMLMIVFESQLTQEAYSNLSMVVGLGLWVFGIWQSIIILKLK